MSFGRNCGVLAVAAAPRRTSTVRLGAAARGAAPGHAVRPPREDAMLQPSGQPLDQLDEVGHAIRHRQRRSRGRLPERQAARATTSHDAARDVMRARLSRRPGRMTLRATGAELGRALVLRPSRRDTQPPQRRPRSRSTASRLRHVVRTRFFGRSVDPLRRTLVALDGCLGRAVRRCRRSGAYRVGVPRGARVVGIVAIRTYIPGLPRVTVISRRGIVRRPVEPALICRRPTSVVPRFT